MRRRRSGRALQALGLGVEDESLLDVLQMNQREDLFLGQQRVAAREQIALNLRILL